MQTEVFPARRQSRLIVMLLLFFSLIAPSPIWPAMGLRGFMLIVLMLLLLIWHLLRPTSKISYRLIIYGNILFLFAFVPALYWVEIRLILYPVFFLASVLLASQVTTRDLEVFITLSTAFMFVLLFGAVLGYALAALELSPLGVFNNTDGRSNYIFYTTLSNSVEAGFIRPAGIYDEPGAFSFFVCIVGFLRHATGRSKIVTLALLTLGLITFSIMHMIFLVLYVIVSVTNFRLLMKLVLGLVMLSVLIFISGQGEMIGNKVLSRLLLTEDGALAGDTRSLLFFNASSVLSNVEHAFWVGADSSCTTDAIICRDLFGPMGENPLSPLVSQGIFLSWPYYLFILATMISLFNGRPGLMFFAVGLLFIQRPYLMNLGYSLLGILAVMAYSRKLNFIAFRLKK